MTANTPANEENVRSISRITGADFSVSGEYCFVKVQADGSVILGGNGDACIGVTRGKASLGHAIEVGISGRMLVQLGGTVVAGASLQCDANGHAITYASGEKMGTSLTGGVAGDISDVLLDRG